MQAKNHTQRANDFKYTINTKLNKNKTHKHTLDVSTYVREQDSQPHLTT